MKDWRLPENRKEMFFRWLNWRLEGNNIDHFTWNNSYANTKSSPTNESMTQEQKYWYSFLFGMTYQSSQAWIFYWHFPNFESINMTDLDKWNRETLPLQTFATDTRYNKGHIVKITESIQEWTNKFGQGSLKKTLEHFLVDDPVKSFQNIYEEIRTLHKYGRMTTWLTTQCLMETAKLPIKPDTMFIIDLGNTSVWNGMCYFQEIEHMTVGDKYAGYVPTPTDKEKFIQYEKNLFSEAMDKIDHPYLSYFTLETHLCQFKKLFVGRDYPGQNIGDAVNRYKNFKEKWPNVSFKAFEDAVNDVMYDVIKWHEESKEMMKLFHLTGQPINMHNLYPDIPNMYHELNLDPNLMLEARNNEEIIKHSIESYANKKSNLARFIV